MRHTLRQAWIGVGSVLTVTVIALVIAWLFKPLPETNGDR